jgi:retron-type reverse transcriptase
MGIASMLKTPETIRTLQRKLYRKAKQEPAYRFYALYDKVYRADILSHAYHLVRANKGSAGIDGVSFEDIEENEGVTVLIAELEEALRNKTYKPDPVKRVMIPKSALLVFRPSGTGWFKWLLNWLLNRSLRQTSVKLHTDSGQRSQPMTQSMT